MSLKRLAIFGIKYYPSKGGSSRVAESVVRELREKYEVTVYCYRNIESKNYLSNVKVVSIPELPFGSFGVFLYYFLCYLHVLFSRGYDLIHVHKTDSAFFIPLLQKKGRIIATSQEAPYKRDKWSWLGKAYFRWMENFFVRSSAVLTSVSKPLAEYYYRTYGRKVHYVPNGVDIDKKRNPNAAETIIKEHGIGEDYLFFAARRIMSTKGCHTFLDAAKKLNYKGPIVIAGEESHTPEYMNTIRSLAEGLDVSFIGYVSDKPTLMSLIEKAKYFLFPSETEGLSLMLLEVASVGTTPLICSDIPENTEVFSDDEVLFFRNKDADHLAEKITWADQNQDKMRMRTIRAADRVLHEYSSAAIASKYQHLYQKVLSEN